MDFISLASSSRGNAYLLKSDKTPPLLLEAGLPISQLRDKLREYGVALSDLAGCLVSHEHGDHSKAVRDLLKAGVDCFMSRGTAEVLGVIGHHRVRAIEIQPHRYWIPPFPWIFSAFVLEHDASEPIGFLIAYLEDRLLFVPDTAYVENHFEGITVIAVECNNISEIMEQNIVRGYIPAIVGKRIRKTHMSLENLITMLKDSDLSRCREVWLLHLSDGNSDEARMKKEIQEAIGIPVMVAKERD